MVFTVLFLYAVDEASRDVSAWISSTFDLSCRLLLAHLTCHVTPVCVCATEEFPVMTGEYCAFEYFNATCRSSGELLYIRSARYGRMRVGGRCVKVDLGYVGCSNDVTHVISSRCTARTQCSVPVGDSELRLRRPCPTDVTWYLEVTYSCIKGVINTYYDVSLYDRTWSVVI